MFEKNNNILIMFVIDWKYWVTWKHLIYYSCNVCV